jgi:hypothetical protein
MYEFISTFIEVMRIYIRKNYVQKFVLCTISPIPNILLVQKEGQIFELKRFI